MGCGPDGGPNGEAYAFLHSEGIANQIIQERHGAIVQGQMIEITRSTYEIMTQALQGKAVPENIQQNFAGPTSAPSTAIGQFLRDAGFPTIRIRGCPLAAQPTDVAEFLQAYNVPPDQIAMGIGQDGGPNGDAYVQ